MGTTLTGTTPQDTYDSLIKVTDNGPLSGTLKKLTDGLGNDSSLSLSTTAASLSGTLAVSGTSSLASINSTGSINGFAGATLNLLIDYSTSSQVTTLTNTELFFGTNANRRMTIAAGGNVGIGTSSPATTLHVDASGGATIRLQRTSASSNRFDVGTDGTNMEFNVRDTGSFTFGGSSSYLRLLSGTGGIQFNGDTAAANALDDYEEGTWTPTIVGNATAGTATYTVQSARYTKIGRMVQYEFWLGWNSGTGTGGLQVAGLPFTASNSSTFPAATIGAAVDIALTADHYLAGYVSSNANTIALYEVPTGGGANNDCPYDAAGQLIISGTYSI
jgi:hypothetical protein